MDRVKFKFAKNAIESLFIGELTCQGTNENGQNNHETQRFYFVRQAVYHFHYRDSQGQ